MASKISKQWSINSNPIVFKVETKTYENNIIMMYKIVIVH